MSENSNLISIIVPVYNTESYLSKCIESILSQTYTTFELLLIDDGSDDDSPAICDRYSQRDDRIRVFHQKNEGVSAARNKGLASMKGEYFCFVDSDDEVEPDLLEKLYLSLKETEADLAICGYTFLSEKKTVTFTSRNEEISGRNNIASFCIDHYKEWLVRAPWGKLYRNIDFTPKSFDENISFGEDLKFNIGFFCSAGKIVVVDEVLYRYKDRDDSLFNTYRDGYFDGLCNVYETVLTYLDSAGLKPEDYLEKVNYNLVSLSFYLMSMHSRKGNTPKETMKFISRVSNSSSMQNAVKNLAPVNSIRERLYISAIRRKNVLMLYFLSLLKSVYTSLSR